MEPAEGDEADVYVPLKERKAAAEASRRSKRARPASLERTTVAVEAPVAGPRPDLLLEQQARGNVVVSDAAKQAALEADLLAQVMASQKAALVSGKEAAQGTVYAESLKTDWRPPRKLRAYSQEKCAELRKKWHILTEGFDVPPPCKSFEEMRLPRPIRDALAAKGIKAPTPIQAQGIPVALSGRDMIGIAFTGSGKTMTFCIPLIMAAWQEELRMPLAANEGPFGIILAPSRELARQHAENLAHLATFITQSGGPQLRVMLAIGGEDLRTQLEPLKRGVHAIVATPGRLMDHLSKRRLGMSLCRYVILDEGDRMLDMGFDEDLKTIFSYFEHQRQTLIFSATMPKKIQDFARSALVKPVVVNVGRAGAANLDVVQDVEYVKPEMRMMSLLTALQKTGPPVVIFADSKRDVDEIHEYLLLKGVGAVAVHGDKSQEERTEAMTAFKAGAKDVLVATDIAAKGLDFPAIQHVLNFDMPKEIETYVHRIGRTGRAGKTGTATTFVHAGIDPNLLLDLKHLLKEAGQRVPAVLLAIDDPADALREAALKAGGAALGACQYCFADDHELLTDRGFMSLDEVRPFFASEEGEGEGAGGAAPGGSGELLFASFDQATGHLVYEHASVLIDNESAAQTMVEFTLANEAHSWGGDIGGSGGALARKVARTSGVSASATTYVDDAVGEEVEEQEEEQEGDGSAAVTALPPSNCVSLLVTPEHDMFVKIGKLCTQGGAAEKITWGGIKRAMKGNNTGIELDFAKVRADALQRDATDKTAIRMRACAPAGYMPPPDTTAPFMEALGLSTEEMCLVFCELYGFWLGDGYLSFKRRVASAGAAVGSGVDGVCFAQVKPADIAWLRTTLLKLALKPGIDYLDHKSGLQTAISIVQPRWVEFFFREYAHKYEPDRNHAFAAMAPSGAAASADEATHARVEAETLKSAKWAAYWAWRLRREQVQRVLDGLRRADGKQAKNEFAIWTSSARFRDEIMRLALHAGCAASFTAEHLAGEHGNEIHGVDIISNRASWMVRYSAAGMRGGYAEPILHMRRDVRAVPYTGRTWCVTVPHGLLVVRRTVRDAEGTVVKASKPVIIGNCSGLGHRITECPKLDRERRTLAGPPKDALGSRGGEW
jgi:ATP-dependent RNA helicase DDX41